MPWNPFRRAAVPVARQNAARFNGAAIALNTNLRTYVNAYTRARNANNAAAMPPINAGVVTALKRYINSKRPRVAGAVAAAVQNAGGSAANAAAAAAGAANAGGAPGNAAAAAAQPLLALGAPATQVGAAAAAAAQQQARNNGANAAAANSAGAAAAAAGVNAARPNATPNQAANAAANAAAAAGLPTNNQAQAAAQAAEPNIPGGMGGVNLNTLRGAINQNVAAMNSARARTEKRRLEVILGRVGNIQNANLRNRVTNYRRRLNNKIAGGAMGTNTAVQGAGFIPGAPAPAPRGLKNQIGNLVNLNTNAKVGAAIRRLRNNNPGANWKGVNGANLTNGQKKVLNGLKLGANRQTGAAQANMNTGNLFKQGN